jgi:hypothetical protein
MNGTSQERLYNLLPALYRQRDPAVGQALRALMSVLESEFQTLEADLTAGYNNWFIQTCDNWVIPYLADLVGIRGLSQEKHVFATQRRQVANTIGYRRRQGTIATLEHVLRDVTGWLVYVVEFYSHLALTQHLARGGCDGGRTVDLRQAAALATLGGPFDELAHSAEVRSVHPEPPDGSKPETLRPGKYSPGSVGLFFWRLRSFRMTNSRPRSIAIPTLLDFLNRAKSASEIVRRIGDDPDFGPPSERAYGVRPSLAQRILEERDRLPNRRFESLEQVDDVRGVGPDTLHDMLARFQGLYTFHPLGVDMPLFNWPQYITEIDQRAASLHMPLALSRAEFAADLEEYQAQFGSKPEVERPSNSRYYGPERGLNVFTQVGSKDSTELEPVSIPPDAVLSRDLSQWDERDERGETLVSRLSERYPTKQVAIDVQLGRLALLNLPEPGDNTAHPAAPGSGNPGRAKNENIRVTYCYGFSTALGGGPYHRQLPRPDISKPLFHIDVAKGTVGINGPTQGIAQGTNGAIGPGCVPTLQAALELWKASWGEQENPRGVIRILDNGVYDEALEIRLPRGAHLSILADNGVRPIVGKGEKLIVVCPDKATGPYEGTQAERQLHLNGLLHLAERQLHLNGLLLHGGLQIGSKEPEKHKEAAGGLIVTLKHCSLVTTGDDGLKLAGIEVALTDLPEKKGVQGLEISIERCILGPLYLPATTESLRLRHSIVDNGSGYAIAAGNTGAQPGPALKLERSTIFGQVHARKVTACDVIFTGPLRTDPPPETRDQIQHSYVPVGSTTLEGRPHPSISTGITPPRFTSTHYGDPAYAQLSLDCPRQIRGGAADGSEMGAFHDLHQTQAEANIRAVLDEYLPLGLRAGIFYVT